MVYQISQTDPDVMTTEDLLSEIDGFTVLAVEVVERLSLILKSLRARRQSHSFFSDRILGFWESIADQTLAAEAAILLANKPCIKAIMTLTRAEQIEVAQGKEIAAAVVALDGTIETKHMPIQRMDQPTLKRVFGPSGIQSIQAQTDMIQAGGKTERHNMITALLDEGLLKIGNQKIKPEDLRAPLLAIGYSLRLSRNRNARKEVA